MSFLGGAECSTAGNPLSQFTKHVQDDKSLQRDRLVGRGPGGMQGLRSNNGLNGSQDNMMNEFMQQGAQLPQSPANGFMMDQMRHEQQFRAGYASPAPEWTKEYGPNMEDQARMEAAFQRPQGASFSPADFSRFQEMNQKNSTGRVASPIQHMQSQMPSQMNGYSNYRPMNSMGMMGMNGGMGMGMGMGMNNGGMGMQYQQPMNQPQQGLQDKGKGKMVELDDEHWEEQFKQIDMEGAEYDETAAEAELNEMDKGLLEQGDYGDFESIWRGIQEENKTARDMDAEEALLTRSLDMGDFNEWDGFDSLGTHAFRDPQLGDYTFEEDNMFQDISNPFDEGQRIMEEGGSLSLAALAFEAAVQKEPTHLAAWVALGAAQAQNEKETPAIRALEQALKLDPNNLEALMGLAVSYTNEGYDSTAYRTLERWLSVKYPNIAPPDSLSSAADIGFTDRHQLHEKVTDLFISAAQLAPDAEAMDPDVQVGLGVLFYGAEEYDKAVDCFSAALASTESGTTNDQTTVHLLWNRLGATLANSGRSEEAIAAYERALSLRPNFVRARYNLGVSCINIGCYEEAAGHLLGALAMHKVSAIEGREKAKDILAGSRGVGRRGQDGETGAFPGISVNAGSSAGANVSEEEIDRMINQNQSTNLYDTLRRVFTQMGRRDLAERVVVGMDVEEFRGTFDF